MKTLVDNFAVLGVEFCLLEGLKDAFTAGTVMRLEDDLVRTIAAENQESMTERTRTKEKLRVLEDGLHTLNRYRRYKHEGKENSCASDGSFATSKLTSITESETVELDDSIHLERPDNVALDLSTAINEDVDDAVLDASQDREDNHLTTMAEGRELNHDPLNDEFLPNGKKSGSKVMYKKKSVRNRAAMFEDTT